MAAPYQELSIHRKMLRDHVRCEAFREAISQMLEPGQTVLDIGAGTGLLSIFAAQAGASKVYAVERTGITAAAREMINRNGVQDRVQVIQDDVESIELSEKVDLIISEWLGGYGIDENMLTSVLVARDRWLKPEGKMLPESVTAWMAPAWDEKLDWDRRFWQGNPYGVDLNLVWESTFEELHYVRNHISSDNLLAAPQEMWTTNVYDFSTEQSRRPFQSAFTFVAKRKGMLNVLATWFHAEMGNGLLLTNAPDAPDTHWGRVVFPLENTVEVNQDTVIEVKFTCEPAGVGYCTGGWSVRIGNGDWEHHQNHRTDNE